MIVVYYDSEVQKAFENLVRNIGTGRNILRKGKMAARMEAMAATANLHDDDDDHSLNDMDDDHYDPLLAKIGYRPRGGIGAFRTTRTMGPGARFDNDREAETYDLADVALEKAQSLCERGAHQSLRDGDCRTELEGVRESFEKVVQLCQTEVQRLEEKKVLKQQRETEAQQKMKKQEEEDSMQDSATGSIEIVHHPALHHHPPNTMVADIEVDEDSDDGEYALPTLPPMRSTRMMGRV
ncbi:hypothetical protein K490DRAFT_70169 [Saccharata proteae CBS 121410]|uniref:Uncharacterized protein n=1 Tax=Saccharata proteae CBS 121410 TaxID=1314787 RepID=A0A9P4HKA3_9PEZI|nr:hypothetical protein K490DRAFT_70169 [Saccharata proteae CBS 121410]